MEFFDEIISDSFITAADLKELLLINNLPKLCQSISSVIRDEHSKGIIYCLWGEFQVNREELKYGIRFSMPHCPNALMWSITKDDSSKSIMIHCTINRKQHDQDFIDSIQEFIRDWSTGINALL